MADYLAIFIDLEETLFAQRAPRQIRDHSAFLGDAFDMEYSIRLRPSDPFAPVVAAAPAGPTTQVIYYQRALDSGTGGYVYWTTFDAPNQSPDPGDTTPNYTGTLSVYTIVRVLS